MHSADRLKTPAPLFCQAWEPFAFFPRRNGDGRNVRSRRGERSEHRPLRARKRRARGRGIILWNKYGESIPSNDGGHRARGPIFRAVKNLFSADGRGIKIGDKVAGARRGGVISGGEKCDTSTLCPHAGTSRLGGVTVVHARCEA